MNKNSISVTLPAETISEVLAALNKAKELLQPHLKTLSVNERIELPKMSDKSISFVSKTTAYCRSNPEFVPTYFKPEELHKDFELVSALKPVLDLCKQLTSDIDDTVMLAGSEAYTAGLMYYGSVQLAAKTGQPAAKPIFDELSQRFKNIGRRSGTVQQTS